VSKDLNILAENRDALLLAEVAAWLHMIAKYQDSFLDGVKDVDIKIPEDITPNYLELEKSLRKNMKSFLKEGFKLPTDVDLDFTICDFIENHRNRDSQGIWVRCLIDAHGRGSGTKKGVLKDQCYFKQDGNIYLSSPFADDKLIKKPSSKKSQFYSFLTDEFKLLSSLSSNNWDLNDWDKWRTQFIDTLHLHFCSSVSDDRIPINDVSLWDQTVSSVAFFKCEIAEALLCGWKDPIQNKPKFRILRIAFDGDEVIAKSSLIGDVLSKRDAIKNGFEEIKKLLEIDYPLGFEVYRDHNQILFLVPHIDKILDFKKDDEFLKLIQKQFDVIFKKDIQLDISVSHSASRNVYFLGSMIDSTKKPLMPSISEITNFWAASEEKCTSCQIRPQSLFFGNRQLCEICFERIKGRSKKWIQDRVNDTIWIDEIADINGKISLIVASFDLKDWLNGKMISTYRNPTNEKVPYFSEILMELDSPLKNYPKIRTQLGQVTKTKNILDKKILSGFKYLHEFYDFLVESEDLAEETYSSLQKNEKLALAIWRKTPSFARIYRVWETTFKFWDTIKENLNVIVKPVPLRLIIKPETEICLPENSSYKAVLDDISFTIFHTEGNEYIIIENLERLAKKIFDNQKDKSKKAIDASSKIRAYLIGKKIEIYDPDGKKRDKPLGSLQVLDVISEDANYVPVIPILAEPSIFMAIVPADKALNISKAIKKKYEEEMGKVRNRLPLTLGMVFAKSHTPISSLMDAGRRMLKNTSTEDEWKVKSVKDEELCDSGHKFRTLEFDNGIEWKVPVTMRDGQTKDIWYPYFYIGDKEKEMPENREKSFKGPDGWLVHASEIKDGKDGDILRILPSTFDFEFLDSSSRRFEVYYDDDGKRRDKTKSLRPYLLEELDEFEKIWSIVGPKKLNRSQLKNVMYLLETKREEWPVEDEENVPVFRNYASDVLKNANWQTKPEKEDFDKIVDSAVTGKLKDVVEIYMDILKVGENEKNDNGGI